MVFFHINASCDEWIHREDAGRAIFARVAERLKRRLKDRKPKPTAENIVNIMNEVCEDLLIASLVERTQSGHGWTKAQTEQVQKYSVDAKFCERLSSAFATGKPPTWDKIDLLLLKNRRELHLTPAFEAKYGKLPGLQDWSPKAIMGLFSLMGILNSDYKGNFEQWFVKRRQRLGMSSKNRYQIKNFIATDDTTRIVRQGRTRKSSLRPGK